MMFGKKAGSDWHTKFIVDPKKDVLKVKRDPSLPDDFLSSYLDIALICLP